MRKLWKVWLFGFLSVGIAFADDSPLNLDATLFRGFRSFGDFFGGWTWYLVHTILVGFSILFLVLAVRENGKPK